MCCITRKNRATEKLHLDDINRYEFLKGSQFLPMVILCGIKHQLHRKGLKLQYRKIHKCLWPQDFNISQIGNSSPLCSHRFEAILSSIYNLPMKLSIRRLNWNGPFLNGIPQPLCVFHSSCFCSNAQPTNHIISNCRDVDIESTKNRVSVDTQFNLAVFLQK